MNNKMKNYKVVWEIDIEATSPEQAAIQARECQNPETTALVFNVVDTETGRAVEIDLQDKTSVLLIDDDDRFPKHAWQEAVAKDDTQLGYIEWVRHQASYLPEDIEMRFQTEQVKCLGCETMISAGIKRGLCTICQSIADKYNALIQAAGYTVKYNGTCESWYALLPGETQFKGAEGNEADDSNSVGHYDQNYLGFFSTHWELLKEVSSNVISDTMGHHNLSDDAWEDLSHEQHLVLVKEAAL